jgi:predicted dehydrogenase
MSRATDTVKGSAPQKLNERLKVALLGSEGVNSRIRVLPALLSCLDDIDLILFDLQPALKPLDGVYYEQVRNNEELGRKLLEKQPRIVIIETQDVDHLEHTELALYAGATQVYVDKNVAARSNQVSGQIDRWEERQPAQQVFILDHYLDWDLLRLLAKKSAQWLGMVTSIQAEFFESQGIAQLSQVSSHAEGVANFFQHALAIALPWFELDDLILLEAGWAQHPDSPIRDTYRYGLFASAQTGGIALDGKVAKYVKHGARKVIHLVGTKGEAWLDRGRNELRVARHGCRPFTVKSRDPNSAYTALARAIVTGKPPAGVMTPRSALNLLKKIEEVHARATERPFYSAEESAEFVTDWAMPTAGPQPAGTVAATSGKTLAYYGIDEVNQDLADSMTAACGATLVPLGLRDPLPNGQYNAVLFDLDSLPPGPREEVLAALSAIPPHCPVGAHSFNLTDENQASLRQNGVVVGRRLDHDLVQRLLK